MATGGGARGWQFLKRNDPYAEACRALTDPAPAFLDAPFPIRRQTGADLEAGPWGLLGWEDPLAANGPCSPIWAVAPMIEVAPAPADGPGLAEGAVGDGHVLDEDEDAARVVAGLGLGAEYVGRVVRQGVGAHGRPPSASVAGSRTAGRRHVPRRPGTAEQRPPRRTPGWQDVCGRPGGGCVARRRGLTPRPPRSRPATGP